MKKFWVLSMAAASAACTAAVGNAQLFQGPYGPGGKWNVYEVVDTTANWKDAQADAASRTRNGKQGNLASIASVAENYFVHRIAGGGDVWIGLTDREGAAPGASESQGTANNQTNGWAWSSGEAFTYQNWGGGEPNNWDAAGAPGTATAGIEDAANLRGDGLWNDQGSGYGLDDPKVPTIVPGSSSDESGGGSLKYVVEYNTLSATPLAGIPQAHAAIFPDARLAGPKGTAGNWAVVEYKLTGEQVTAPAWSVVRQIEAIEANELSADKFEASMKYLDVTDPGTNATGGPILRNELDAGLTAYPSGGGDDIISIAHGRIKVAEAGKYTFNVHSDDGFAMRIFGANFESNTGGQIDPVNRNTLFFPDNTGDSNTQGVVDLAVGEYNVEFMSWERGGGAFYELSAAKGDYVNNPDGIVPQYTAVGDPSVIPGKTERPAVALTGPLTVANLNDISDLSLEVNRENLIDALATNSTSAIRTDVTETLLDDNNRTAGCPFGDFPAFRTANTAQFPNSSDGSALDNFSTIVKGGLTIDDGDATAGETLTVSFHVDSDDRSLFHIKGANFTDTSGQQILSIDGDDAMFADVDTCNTNFTGVVQLKEGVAYDFDAIHVEAGGDAGLQILAAIGDYVNNPLDATKFFPLRSNFSTVTFGRNVGFTLVPEVDGIKGDFNQNGQLDAGDLDLLAGGQIANNAAFDLDADGDADYDDRLVWVNTLKKTYIGDANLDGEFNTGDFVEAFAAGKFETGQDASWSEGDWDGDKKFGTGDFVAAFQQGGYELGPRAAVSAVPEPASLTMFGLTAFGLLGMARRRRA